ncbi:ABC transporter substrate-binding protein [Streptomyces sp. NPDC006384]
MGVRHEGPGEVLVGEDVVQRVQHAAVGRGRGERQTAGDLEHGRPVRLEEALHQRRVVAAPVGVQGLQLRQLGPYREPADGFQAQVERMREHGAGIVTSAATAADLALFHQQARRAGLRPRLITCSRWLTYPHTHTTAAPDIHAELADARVATLVYWSPNHPYRSSLDGTTCADLAHAYQRDTGESWLQPLGLAHALVETAHHALGTADDPTDRGAIARAIAGTALPTIVGTLDWKKGPTPNIALLRLAGGQWHTGPKGPRLAVVTNTQAPDVPVTGELRTA